MDTDQFNTYFPKFYPVAYDTAKAVQRAEIADQIREFESRNGPIKTLPITDRGYVPPQRSLTPSKAMRKQDARKMENPKIANFVWRNRMEIRDLVDNNKLCRRKLAEMIGVCTITLRHNLSGKTVAGYDRAMAIEAAVREMLAEVSP